MLYTCSPELKEEMKAARARVASSTRYKGNKHPETVALTRELNRLQCLAHWEGAEPLVHALTDEDLDGIIATAQKAKED